MTTIRAVDDLPEWFNKERYKKNLSAVEWYREVRKRDYFNFFMNVCEHRYKNIDTTSELLDLFLKVPVHDSWLYAIAQDNAPVQDLVVLEALFLAAAAMREKDIAEVGQKLNDLILLYEQEVAEERPIYSLQYEDELSRFVDLIDKQEKGFSPVFPFADIGNIYLSYGRPLNGCPVTIDTQYDDETILAHVKQWLARRRKTEGTKAKRQLNQNDFDDWQYYRIREIYDLDTWARISKVKILDHVVAAAVWPNAPDDFSPIDVLRTTARKRVKEVFCHETAVRFYGQLRLALGEDFLTD